MRKPLKSTFEPTLALRVALIASDVNVQPPQWEFRLLMKTFASDLLSSNS